jgi:hypothetical protein
MPKRIVDFFKAIEVEHEERNGDLGLSDKSSVQVLTE